MRTRPIPRGDRTRDLIDQLDAVDRLSQKGECACGEGAVGGVVRVMARDHYRRDREVGSLKKSENLEPTRSRHLQVQHNAVGRVLGKRLKEGIAAGPRHRIEARAAHHSFQPPANVGFVIDDGDLESFDFQCVPKLRIPSPAGNRT